MLPPLSRFTQSGRTELKHKGKGTMGRLALLVTIVAVVGTAFAATAFANNLDRNTAQRALKQVAKKDCLATSGCETYKAEPVKLITFHRAQGKIHVVSHKNGIRYDCVRSVTLKLNHFTGRITYSTGRRNCTNLGPQ